MIEAQLYEAGSVERFRQPGGEALQRRARSQALDRDAVAMAYAQLNGAASLRHIEAGLRSQRSKLCANPIRRSTLADANATRPADVLTGLFSHMVARADRRLRRNLIP